MTEASKTFTCYGGACTIVVDGPGPGGSAEKAMLAARDELLAWHEVYSRFKPTSELTSLNRDPRERVPVSPAMARFVRAAIDAAQQTDGLVDAALCGAIEDAGYRKDHLQGSFPLPLMLAMGPPRQAAGARATSRWGEISVDLERGTVTRPPGVRFDGGGLVKGLSADVLAEQLSGHESFAIDCVGDLRIGGTGGVLRSVQVAAPFSGQTLHELAVKDGAVATCGISVRSWLDAGKPKHHILDPATGNPAYTGIVQVTALAPTALEGEVLAKAALLSGPEAAPGWLRHGGVIVLDSGAHAVIPAS